jgi:tetratricopeptide (TPR) repeat protein
VSPAEIARLQRRDSTTPETEAAYFEGLHFLNQYGAANATRALEAFERATRFDARYQQAYVGLSRSYFRLGADGAITQAEARAKALAATTRAMELDDQSAEAHAATGDLQFSYDWNWKGAEQSYRRALQLNPSSSWARQQFARYLAAVGRLDEAVEQAQRATAVDPLSVDAAQTYALMLYFDRREDDAANVLEHALETDSSSAGTRVILSRVRETQNRVKEALEEAQAALAIAEHPGVRAHVAREKALVGDEAGARAELEAVTNGRLRSRPDSRAYALLALGDTDGALSLLEEAEANRDPAILWLAVDPRVDSLRTRPRFTSLLRRMDLPLSLDGGTPRH